MSVTAITDSRADRDILITENMGLVHTCAHRFTGKGIEYEDLFQAGCMGLVKAFDAFDRERGVRFSTYAVPVILGEIKKLFRDGGTVKVSRSLKELSLRINAAREHHSKLCGAEPTLSQLAEELGEEDRLIIQLRFYGGKTQSDTAKLLHTTQVQISRRERKILKVMRDRLLDE